jgi:hypothetical protein
MANKRIDFGIHDHAKSTADRLRLASLQQLSAPSRGARSGLRESARQLRGIALVQVPNAKIRNGVGGMFLIGHYHLRQRPVRRKSSFHRAIYHSRAGPMPYSIP